MFTRTIVTATELGNFFKLRLAPDAQPEIQSLAKAMKESMEAATPAEHKWGMWHIPYGDLIEEDDPAKMLIRSIAACARVSVVRGDGKKTTFEEDAKFVANLLKNGHMSPFEHVAECADIIDFRSSGMFANFYMWKSFRWQVEHELTRKGAQAMQIIKEA